MEIAKEKIGKGVDLENSSVKAEMAFAYVGGCLAGRQWWFSGSYPMLILGKNLGDSSQRGVPTFWQIFLILNAELLDPRGTPGKNCHQVWGGEINKHYVLEASPRKIWRFTSDNWQAAWTRNRLFCYVGDVDGLWKIFLPQGFGFRLLTPVRYLWFL